MIVGAQPSAGSGDCRRAPKKRRAGRLTSVWRMYARRWMAPVRAIRNLMKKRSAGQQREAQVNDLRARERMNDSGTSMGEKTA